MMRLRYILLVIVAALTSVVAEASQCIETYDVAKNSATPVEEPCYDATGTAMPLISTSTSTSQHIAPTPRTLHRSVRQSVREELSTIVIRSIDSTTSASRYGLYNHKILFFAYPRHYYLMALVRLII